MKQPIIECKNADEKVGPSTSVAAKASRFIRRRELRQIAPLSDTTIYEMERRGEFPRRIALTPRCVAWHLAEIEAWLEQRRLDVRSGLIDAPRGPDVRLRRTRPVKRQKLVRPK